MGQELIYLGRLMAIKLIAIDMDGTLLLPDHTISPPLKMRLPQLAPVA